MGATEFMVSSEGATAKEAFDAAVEKAQYDHGHAGYTGTIAEKNEFHEIPFKPVAVDGPTSPLQDQAEKFAWRLLEGDDGRCNDKWGPAGCVKIAKGHYLFFGWASS